MNRTSLMCSENIIKEAIAKKTLDNISCIVIVFDNFISSLYGKPQSSYNIASNNTHDLNFTPKKTLPPIGLSKVNPITHTNFDLGDNDIDKTHSAKAIEYMLSTVKKVNIGLDNDAGSDFKYANKPPQVQSAHPHKPALYTTNNVSTLNTTPHKVVDKLKYSYRLPKMTDKPKLPYSESFSNVKTRHHTQPRSSTQLFTVPPEYAKIKR